jgi:hypothetical protein
MCSPEYIYGLLVLAGSNEPVWPAPGVVALTEPERWRRRPVAAKDLRPDRTPAGYPGAAPVMA